MWEMKGEEMKLVVYLLGKVKDVTKLSFYTGSFILLELKTCWQNVSRFSYLPPAYVVRGKVMFSVCLSVQTWGGGGTYLLDGGGRGYLLSGLDGGGYLPSQVWVGGYLLSGLDGGVPTFPGPGGGGGTYSQVWMGGVPTFPGPGGGVPTQVWMEGVPT